MNLVFKVFSRMPLWLLHGLGWLLGWLAFLLSPAYRRELRANAHQAGIQPTGWLRAIGEAGKMVAELPRLWLGRPVAVHWDASHLIDKALQDGGGLVFLTPHMGSFEVTAQAYADRFGRQGRPVTVLYRPARQMWLRAIMESARKRPGMDIAPASLAGVKKLIKALQQGDCVGLLPDQVPPDGQGLWLPFFGRDAYTMTLSARLALQPGASVLLIWAERLSWGKGYMVRVRSMPVCDDKTVEGLARHINASMEQLIRENPAQYLWGYARYKPPKDRA